ncbi:hypothetical protein KY331_02255 [Candidatus Woesearchaeota archaeon]|nr:hypothetical protein [Candidatus Woesearchaeota archaeon]
MPPAQFHFAVGAFIGFIIVLFFIPLKKKWLKWIPFIITLFGVLAMVPDVGKFAADFPLLGRTPLTSPLLEKELIKPQYDNLFFYHGYLDRNTNSEVRGDLAILGFFVTVVIYSLTSVGYIIYAKEYMKKPSKK